MRLAIIGSRTFNNYKLMFDTVDYHFGEFYPPDSIVSGGADGADKLAEKLAGYLGIPIKIFKPDWGLYGKSAGFKRNELIINEADFVLAFYDGQSRGTAHSLDLARKQKKPTLIIYF